MAETRMLRVIYGKENNEDDAERVFQLFLGEDKIVTSRLGGEVAGYYHGAKVALKKVEKHLPFVVTFDDPQ